jgi:hypothetical protein
MMSWRVFDIDRNYGCWWISKLDIPLGVELSKKIDNAMNGNHGRIEFITDRFGNIEMIKCGLFCTRGGCDGGSSIINSLILNDRLTGGRLKDALCAKLTNIPVSVPDDESIEA